MPASYGITSKLPQLAAPTELRSLWLLSAAWLLIVALLAWQGTAQHEACTMPCLAPMSGLTVMAPDLLLGCS